MLDPVFDQALRSPQPLEQLRQLATTRFAQGRDQATLLADFEQARQHLRDAGQEEDEDTLLDAMDMLVGWCSPHVKLLPVTTSKADNG